MTIVWFLCQAQEVVQREPGFERSLPSWLPSHLQTEREAGLEAQRHSCVSESVPGFFPRRLQIWSILYQLYSTWVEGLFLVLAPK